MIKIVHGNLLDSDASYICHQVNCQGVMGSGVAKQIKDKWPDVYTRYKEMCSAIQPEALLGFAQIIGVGQNQYVCNLFGQLNYGRSHTAYTDVFRLRDACRLVINHAQPGATFAMPYRIGCGLGGGDWCEVLDMLTDVFKDHDLALYKMT